MRLRLFTRFRLSHLPFCAALCLALTTLALGQQGAFQGQWHCKAFSESHALTVPSQPHHQFTISQGECTSTGGNKIAGETLQSDVVTSAAEVTPSWMRTQAYDVITSNTGDHLYVRTQEHGRIVNGEPAKIRSHWRAVGGTGKLSNVRLRGTYTVTTNSDGTADVKVQGQPGGHHGHRGH